MTLAQPSVRSYLGVAKEVTKGTPVAATAFIPINKDSFKPVDIIGPLYDEGLRGSMVQTYGYIQGRRHTEIDLGGLAYADTIGWILQSVLGADNVTGSTAPYTHAISLKNATSGDAQPDSLTITDYYAAGTRYYPGCQFHDFTLTFNADGQLEYTTKATGFPSTTTSAPTPSFSTVTATPVWTGTVTIAGSAKAYTQSGTLTMSRKIDPIFGISNTQAPYQVFVGALQVTGKLTFVMENDDELTRFLTNTQPSLVFNFSQGSSTTATEIQFTVSKGAYTTGAIERTQDHVQVTVDITAIANTSDAGASSGYAPIKWELKNAVASY